MPKKDSSPQPRREASGRKPKPHYTPGKTPPLDASARQKTDKRGGSVDPLPGAKARMTSSDNHTPDMLPRKPITRKPWRETPGFSRKDPTR